MQKAPQLSGKDALRLRPIGFILPQSATKNQLSRFSKLSNCIRRRQLSEALELLEKRGLTGDTALFVLNCINQSLRMQGARYEL